jgi:hypothetical protein
LSEELSTVLFQQLVRVRKYGAVAAEEWPEHHTPLHIRQKYSERQRELAEAPTVSPSDDNLNSNLNGPGLNDRSMKPCTPLSSAKGNSQHAPLASELATQNATENLFALGSKGGGLINVQSETRETQTRNDRKNHPAAQQRIDTPLTFQGGRQRNRHMDDTTDYEPRSKRPRLVQRLHTLEPTEPMDTKIPIDSFKEKSKGKPISKKQKDVTTANSSRLVASLRRSRAPRMNAPRRSNRIVERKRLEELDPIPSDITNTPHQKTRKTHQRTHGTAHLG